jgi:hypothetical protein
MLLFSYLVKKASGAGLVVLLCILPFVEIVPMSKVVFRRQVAIWYTPYFVIVCRYVYISYNVRSLDVFAVGPRVFIDGGP